MYEPMGVYFLSNHHDNKKKVQAVTGPLGTSPLNSGSDLSKLSALNKVLLLLLQILWEPRFNKSPKTWKHTAQT